MQPVCNGHEYERFPVGELLAAEIKNIRDVLMVADPLECAYEDARVYFVRDGPANDDVLERVDFKGAD